MRASFVCFVSLFCALPVLCGEYHIHSQYPDMFIFSNGKEKPGDLVQTVPKIGESYPPYTVVTIHAPISNTEPTCGAVSCNGGGLFIGLNKECNRLEWKTEPFNWTFNPGTVSPFHVISLPDQSKIWFDNVHDECVVEVVKVPLTSGDAFWCIDEA